MMTENSHDDCAQSWAARRAYNGGEAATSREGSQHNTQPVSGAKLKTLPAKKPPRDLT